MALPLVSVTDKDATASFEDLFEHSCNRYRELWLSTEEETPRIGAPRGRLEQWRNGRAARRLIDRLAAEIPCYPESENERLVWRDDLREVVRDFGEQHLGWPGGYRKLVFDSAFFDTTVLFSREARAFDPNLSGEELMQALRNVWIMNSIQVLLDLEVCFTPSVFAYSMLYPCTDNLLDDPQLPMTAKRAFNQRLGRRLCGERAEPVGAAERNVFRLVDLIETQFGRARYPQVWCSVQAIHRGQVDSLRQQTGNAGDLLEISLRKGGASVLADGYLVAGHLEAAEADFCFGYGAFLQLLDDLQDARDDRRAGHDTLFSTAELPLDGLVSRLYRFMHQVVNESQSFGDDSYSTRRDLILRNCSMLLVGAVAAEPKLCSRSFRRSLERQWPMTFRTMRRLRTYGEGRLRSAAAELERRQSLSSMFDLLI